MIEQLNKLEQKINIKFKDQELLKKSLIHKSFNSNNNNEKLEFLGDRVLGLILAKTLLKIYPNEKEGVIDKKFANLVNKKTCLMVAKKIELKKYITTGNSYKGLSRSDDKIISDGLEALLAAIYLDQGIVIVEKFILNFWGEFLDKSLITKIDAKTQLQEYSLKKIRLYQYTKLTSNQDLSIALSLKLKYKLKVLKSILHQEIQKKTPNKMQHKNCCQT